MSVTVDQGTGLPSGESETDSAGAVTGIPANPSVSSNAGLPLPGDNAIINPSLDPTTASNAGLPLPNDQTTTQQTPSATQAASQDNSTAVTPSASTTSAGGLPWAIVLMPTTSAGQGGIGNNRHGLQPETWVYGFFADGDDCQQPVIVGVFPGGQGVSSTAQAPTDNSTTPNSTVPSPSTSSSSSTTSSSSTSSSSPTPAGNVTGSNIAFVYNRLIAKGYTPAQASGIIGNLMIESGDSLNSGNPGEIGGDSGHSHGIAQWNDTANAGYRWQALQRYAGKNSPYDIGVQTDFIDYELKNNKALANASKLMANAKNPTDAAIAYMNAEMPKGFIPGRSQGATPAIPSFQQRINNAKAIYQQFNSGTATPTAPLATTPSS